MHLGYQDFQKQSKRKHNLKNQHKHHNIDQFQINNFRNGKNNDLENSKKLESSNIHNSSFKSEKSFQRSFKEQDSRNIMQISYLNQQSGSNNSFRFQNNDPIDPKKENARYQHLKMLLAESKQKSRTQFQKNLSIPYQSISEPRNISKQEFQKNLKGIKEVKKSEENNFYHLNKLNIKTYNYKQDKLYNNYCQQPSFKKKPSNNLLPDDFSDENFFNVDESQQAQHHKETDHIKQAKRFLDKEAPVISSTQKKSSRKKNKAKRVQPLDIIREEKATIFQQTYQQQKMNILLNNYKDMRSNFDNLIDDMKNIHHGQQQIEEQIKKIQEQFQNQQKEIAREKKKAQFSEALEAKKKRFQWVKQQLQKIKEKNKGAVYSKMNEKIQSLESAVKQALEHIVAEKQQPSSSHTSISYSYENPYTMNNQISRISSRVGFSQQSYFQPMRKESRYSISRYAQSEKKIYEGVMLSHVNLSDNNDDDFQDEQNDWQFYPLQSAQQYFPRPIDTSNSNLRNCLTKKSSLIFQNFQFQVSARFTVQNNEVYPVIAQVRVGNKSMIDLAEVYVVVLGLHGSQILSKPNKIFFENLHPQGCFNFTVFLTQENIQSNAFQLEVRFKSDKSQRKKINITVPLPLMQLIIPEDIEEQQFIQGWNMFNNELYIAPNTLDFIHIRSHEDIRLILPFKQLVGGNPNIFSYGIMFRYLKSDLLFFVRLDCFINGKASIHLRTDKDQDLQVKEQLLDILNFLFFNA